MFVFSSTHFSFSTYLLSLFCLEKLKTLSNFLLQFHCTAFQYASNFNSDLSMWQTAAVTTLQSSTFNFCLGFLCSFSAPLTSLFRRIYCVSLLLIFGLNFFVQRFMVLLRSIKTFQRGMWLRWRPCIAVRLINFNLRVLCSCLAPPTFFLRTIYWLFFPSKIENVI